MKKILLSLCGLAMALSVAGRDFSYTYEGKTLSYSVLDEDAKTCGVKAGENEVSGDVVIPTSAGNDGVEYKVVAVLEDAFYENEAITSVVIPNSVTSIEDSAFWGCTGLTSVVLPESLGSLGEYAFRECSGLTTISLPNTLEMIATKVFQDCTSLTSIELPNALTSIESYAFKGCSSLTSISFPETLTLIDTAAFRGCVGLTAIEFPASLTEIASMSFDGCDNIKKVTVMWETPLEADNEVFTTAVYDAATLYVPNGKLEAYKTVAPWSEFKTIEAKEASAVEGIAGESAGMKVYNMQGFKAGESIEGLAPGVYVIIRNNHSEKRVIR